MPRRQLCHSLSSCVVAAYSTHRHGHGPQADPTTASVQLESCMRLPPQAYCPLIVFVMASLAAEKPPA
jgi:hypothetical protein